MPHPSLSFSTRKALCVHLGESAGKELADFLLELSDRIDRLERTKVDVTPIVRVAPAEEPAKPTLRRAA